MGSTLVTVFRIPAFTRQTAIGRARGNARLKGLEGFSVMGAEKDSSTGVPGQSFYLVEVESKR